MLENYIKCLSHEAGVLIHQEFLSIHGNIEQIFLHESMCQIWWIPVFFLGNGQIIPASWKGP